MVAAFPRHSHGSSLASEVYCHNTVSCHLKECTSHAVPVENPVVLISPKTNVENKKSSFLGLIHITVETQN